MGIDLSAANCRARELQQQASNLRNAKAELNAYMNLLSTYWEGNEVKYYRQAITNLQNRLTNAASSLDSLASSVVSTANEIREEELYQEWLAEQERIRAAEAAAAEAAAATARKPTKAVNQKK